MSHRTSPIPLDLSGHRELPPAEIAPLLERVAAEPEERALSALTALLMNRVLRLLRQGSQEDLHEEALMPRRACMLSQVDQAKRSGSRSLSMLRQVATQGTTERVGTAGTARPKHR